MSLPGVTRRAILQRVLPSLGYATMKVAQSTSYSPPNRGGALRPERSEPSAVDRSAALKFARTAGNWTHGTPCRSRQKSDIRCNQVEPSLFLRNDISKGVPGSIHGPTKFLLNRCGFAKDDELLFASCGSILALPMIQDHCHTRRGSWDGVTRPGRDLLTYLALISLGASGLAACTGQWPYSPWQFSAPQSQASVSPPPFRPIHKHKPPPTTDTSGEVLARAEPAPHHWRLALTCRWSRAAYACASA